MTVRKKTRKKIVMDPLDRKIRRLEERLKEARHVYLRKHRWMLIMFGGSTLWWHDTKTRAAMPIGSIAVPTETAISLQRAWDFAKKTKTV